MEKNVFETFGLKTQQSFPWGQKAKKIAKRVGEVICNPGGFAGEVHVQREQEGHTQKGRETQMILAAQLQDFAALGGAGAIPHGDEAGQDALNGASKKGVHNGSRGSCSSQFLQKVELLLGFFWPETWCWWSRIGDLYTKELGAVHLLQCNTIDG